jgi:hypothetical protein
MNQDLNVSSINSYWKGDYYNVVGEVANNGPASINYVEIISTIYDKDNKVIGTKNTFTHPTTILSLNSSPFDLMIGPNDVSNIDSISKIKLVVNSN